MILLTLMIATVAVLGTFAEPDPEPFRRLDYKRPSNDGYESFFYSKPGYIKFPSALDFKPSGLKSNYEYDEPKYEHEEPKYEYEQPKYGYCDPRAPPKCAQYNATYCIEDFEYPESEIQYAIEYDTLVLKKYAENADQSADNLVKGVSSYEEKYFDYSLYTGLAYDKGNWVGGEGYICPSEVRYARPLRAKNAMGEWRVIVQNIAHYSQTQRIETCLVAGSSCRTLAPCYRSQCVQKYVYHRMLSFDPCDASKGLFIDIYKLPSACSCHIPN